MAPHQELPGIAADDIGALPAPKQPRWTGRQQVDQRDRTSRASGQWSTTSPGAAGQPGSAPSVPPAGTTCPPWTCRPSGKPALKPPSVPGASSAPALRHSPFALQPQLYHPGSRTLAHLHAVPVLYDFDHIRNCPHCRETPGDRGCQAWSQATKGVIVLRQAARCTARDVTEFRGATGGSVATLYQFVDGSIAYSAPAAPPWREAGEVTGRALENRGVPGPNPHRERLRGGAQRGRCHC